MGKKDAKEEKEKKVKEEKEKKVKEEEKENDKKIVDAKDDSPVTVILKIEMHCEDCAQKVRRSVKGFKGVEAVSSDVSESKLTVIGNVDPVELRSQLEKKTHKNVDLISPVLTVKKDKEIPKAQKSDKGKESKKPDPNKKPQEPSVITVVLKIRLHCDGCILRIRKQINKIKGVQSISIDSEKDLVTVKGTMDANIIAKILMEKLKRTAEIIDQKKEGDKDKDKEKKEKKNANVDAEKKEKQKADKSAVAKAVGNAIPTETAVGNAKETVENAIPTEENYDGGYGNYLYRTEMLHAPQLFSDENPNACYIM